MQRDAPAAPPWEAEPCAVLCCAVLSLQVLVWQKASAADHRSALVAALGPGAVGSLLPCHHRQGQPEVSRSAQLGLCSFKEAVCHILLFGLVTVSSKSIAEKHEHCALRLQFSES